MRETPRVLFCLEGYRRNNPLLPLATEGLYSPLYPLIREDLRYTGQRLEERASELTIEWMGPGPWPLRFNPEIPDIPRWWHPTNTIEKGRIIVSHALKIIIRVEIANQHADDRGRGNSLFDIILECSINLLSVSNFISWCCP